VWRVVLGLALAASSPSPGFPDKLDDFEDSATGNGDDGGRDDGSHDGDSYYDADDSADDTAANAILLMSLVPIYGGIRSWARATDGSVGDVEANPRRAGVATIPFIRVDAAYQLVESDIEAWDIRGEGGFGPFAVQVRETHYEEDRPSEDLDLVQAHALLRMEFIDALEVDLGLGGLVVHGDDINSGVSGTIPVLIHPWDFLGLEFRPAWAGVNDNLVEDYDLSLLAGWRFISARAGYRWTESGGSSLNGPIFGFAARW
jgi:hypothetical protein